MVQSNQHPSHGWVPSPPGGTRVDSVNALSTPQHYIVYPITNSLALSLRRISYKRSKTLPQMEYEFQVDLFVRHNTAEDDIISFRDTLTDLVVDIYEAIAAATPNDGHNYGININASFNGLEGAINTQFAPIQPTREAAVQTAIELIDQLDNFSQSAKTTGDNISQLTISATVTGFGTRGQGQPLPISDAMMRRKAFSKECPNNSIFYVDSSKDCLFIAIYYGILHKLMSKTFYNKDNFTKRASYQEHKQRAAECGNEFYKALALKNEELEEACEKFFHDNKIYLKDYRDKNTDDSSTRAFLKKCHLTFCVQISIFGQSSDWNLTERYPPELVLNLPQVSSIYLVWKQIHHFSVSSVLGLCCPL